MSAILFGAELYLGVVLAVLAFSMIGGLIVITFQCIAASLGHARRPRHTIKPTPPASIPAQPTDGRGYYDIMGRYHSA